MFSASTVFKICCVYVYVGDADMLFLLLHYNADPNVTDTHGDNLLLWLVRKQIHSDVMLTNVKLLMHFGIDLYAADSEGNTLLHLLLLAMVSSVYAT